MTERVDDQTCEHIQKEMADIEKKIDAFLASIKQQNRYSSLLALHLKDLHRSVCTVHRSAGLEMER
jgi:hypothetical protein